jgi:integrase
LRVNPKSRPWHHLTPDEFNRLLSVVSTARQRAAYWLMYACGLRAGEVYNLTVANIDLEHRRVHIVNRAAGDDIPPFTVKAEGQSAGSKERSVPIPDAALPDLTEAMRGAFKAGGFVMLTADRYRIVREHWRLCRETKSWGGHAWRPWQNRDMANNVLRDTKNFLRRARIELSGPFNLNAFRKSYAQNLANAGTPPRTLAQLLGHANTRVTMQFYNRVTDANEKAAGEAMNRLLAPKTDNEQRKVQG